MKVHAESMFKNKTQPSLLNHHKALPVSSQRKAANNRQKLFQLIAYSSEANIKKDPTEMYRDKGHLKLPALLKPGLTSDVSLLNKQYGYYGDYDYFDMERLIEEDLCRELRTMKVQLPYNLMKVRHNSTFKLPKIPNTLIKVNSLRPKQTFNTNIQGDKENDGVSINKEPVSASTYNRPFALEPLDVDNNFKIDIQSINENPISSRTHSTMHKYGSRVYIVGGLGRKMFAETVIYDTSNQQILEFKSTLFKRARHASARIGNFIVIHGGMTLESYGSRFTLSDTILFDLRQITRKSRCQFDQTQVRPATPA